MTEFEFLEIIEAVCKHPGLYVPTGSFYEAVSFFEGYGSGAEVGDKAYHSALTPFLRWLTPKLAPKEKIIDWVTFRECYSTDAHAFENLSLMYREYLAQKSPE